ncbi:MAG TPA: hypothetical protein VFX20_12935 [Steroidobacteraceae bacterium]|nr:hypothetical protein [Steroidobacteraceae bacterium]
MKTGVFLIAILLLAACAAKPPRCDRRLTPINASRAAASARLVGP